VTTSLFKREIRLTYPPDIIY